MSFKKSFLTLSTRGNVLLKEQKSDVEFHICIRVHLSAHSRLTVLSWLRDLHYYTAMFPLLEDPVQIIKGGAARSHACSLGLAIKYKNIR